MWASSLWVPKHCPFPAIISFTAVGMLKNYGWLRRRGTKIIVTFKSLAESQIRCCLKRFSISAAAVRERFRNGWIYFWSVLNSNFLFWNAELLLACWGPACPFSLSQPWPGLSYSFLSAVINRDHLVYFSFFFFLSAIPPPLPVLEELETAEMEARKLGCIEGLGCCFQEMFTCQVLTSLLPPHHWGAFRDLLATAVVSEWDNLGCTSVLTRCVQTM